MKPTRILVKSSSRTYSVVCGPGVLRRMNQELVALGKFSSVHLLCSPRVWRAVGPKLRSALGREGASNLHLFDDAEAHKNLRTVESVSRALSRVGADRKSLLIAVGGGVVGDVAGYVAASYLRGVALVHIPTTLVAQVDSAIGGKTGVNLPEGKNLVGAFYSPDRVLIDPELLRTLPDREFRGGLAEVIKYGVIADKKLFAYLESNFSKILRRDADALRYIIPRCVEIKARVVSRDERESGLREILNFGHTFAHALESLTKYRRYQHGEAVALGMMTAALLAHEAGITRARHVERLVSLVRQLGPLPPWPRVSPKRFIDAMRSDKKARAGRLRFVLSPRIGKAASYDSGRNTIEEQLVTRVLHFAPRLLAAHAAAYSASAGKSRA
jgi:3-dehydroquinate synthase